MQPLSFLSKGEFIQIKKTKVYDRLEKHVLSKSTFIRGLQCAKSLYLYKNNFHERDQLSATQQAIFSRGNAIGLLAQKLFPGGVDASPSSKFNYAEAVEKTKRLISEKVAVIYEACFQADGIYAALDILVLQDGKYVAYEVKSSAKITNTYLVDAALQYFVITQSGINLDDFFIVYVNTSYMKGKSIVPENYFKRKSVKQTILLHQNMIQEKAQELMQVLLRNEAPDIKIGEQCHAPYACDFIGTCRGQLEANSIFFLSGASKQTQYELYYSGIKSMLEIPAEYTLTEEQKIQVECLKTGKAHIDKVEIKRFVASVKYPVQFLDFEIFMPAIPLFDASSPYQHIPFLYSVHTKKGKEEKLQHTYFLAEAGYNPTYDFIVQLISDVKNAASILIFDATHEIKVLNKAGQLFPDLKNEIKKILDKIIDLSLPFQSKHFYTSEMKGSYSMKSLLPAIAPELSFDSLKIKNGIAALTAFEKLGTESDLFQTQENKESLIEYCKMDTLGLVKIFELLEMLATETE